MSAYPKQVTDQLQRTLELPALPKRIISLVPSQTELLFDLGLREEVIGITKFCIHPTEWFRSKLRVGGTKQFDFKKISALAPDLIIGNKEENEEHAIKQLMELYPVWMSDIKTLEQALHMIKSLGELTSRQTQASAICTAISNNFETLVSDMHLKSYKRAAYFIWKNPYMVAGHSTFINDMLTYCRLENVFNKEVSRYPEITLQQLVAADPEVILLSSEPYPFKEKHIQEFKEALPRAKVIVVDGELFSWYGSRLLHSAAYLRELSNNF